MESHTDPVPDDGKSPLAETSLGLFQPHCFPVEKCGLPLGNDHVSSPSS